MYSGNESENKKKKHGLEKMVTEQDKKQSKKNNKK